MLGAHQRTAPDRVQPRPRTTAPARVGSRGAGRGIVSKLVSHGVINGVHRKVAHTSMVPERARSLKTGAAGDFVV